MKSLRIQTQFTHKQFSNVFRTLKLVENEENQRKCTVSIKPFKLFICLQLYNINDEMEKEMKKFSNMAVNLHSIINGHFLLEFSLKSNNFLVKHLMLGYKIKKHS